MSNTKKITKMQQWTVPAYTLLVGNNIIKLYRVPLVTITLPHNSGIVIRNACII